MSDQVRIGNAQAFWGDRSDAAAEMLAREPDLDYLTLDYLAEVSMSILAVQRERDPAAGYARDFVAVVRSLAPYWTAGGRCRLIANAGGLNPSACARACAAALAETNCRRMKIAVVGGDDILERARSATDEVERRQLDNLDTGESLSGIVERLVTANAYLGATPIVQALEQGADIVITGRVADPSLTVAPCRYHFGWSDHDWTPLAGATVAGHLIECGTQVTGGIWTDWLNVPDPVHIGFPIVEIASDGSCVVTKPAGTGGCVNEWTVKEQLLYEIGDPAHVLTPDVTASFLRLLVEDFGGDRVRVTGALGQPPPSTLKVSATYRDGYRAAGTLTIYGRDAVAKARRCGEIVLQRVRESGHVLRDSLVECLATGVCAPNHVAQPGEAQLLETVLRIVVESDSRSAVERFTRDLAPLVTSGPQGTTGYAEGRPRVHPVFRYWPCLVDRSRVTPHVELIETPGSDTPPEQRPPAGWPTIDTPTEQPTTPLLVRSDNSSDMRTLRDVAYARSGDKGISANLGVIARRSEDYRFLCTLLTAECVQEFFRPLGVESVERYELPNLNGLNFILRGILRRSLRTDAQGKALAQALLEMPLPKEWQSI